MLDTKERAFGPLCNLLYGTDQLAADRADPAGAAAGTVGRA